MILSTLGLNPHDFALGLSPKGLMPMEISFSYKPMIFSMCFQYGTMFATLQPQQSPPQTKDHELPTSDP